MKKQNKKWIAQMILGASIVFMYVLAASVIAYHEVRAESWECEAGCTTYLSQTSTNGVGWYPRNKVVDIIGVSDDGSRWQTSDDLWIEQDEARRVPIGTFLLTQYTPSPSENGGYSVTATGHSLTDNVGWAVAVDPRIIPLRSTIYIDGVGKRKALDTGGAIKGYHIDVLDWSEWGYNPYREVFMYK